MSILIKGMEMPKTGEYRCIIRQWKRGEPLTMDLYGEKELCGTITPIPPHGDLIDRKAAYDSLLDGMVMTGYQSRALDCISDFYVPTIIEAEEGE